METLTNLKFIQIWKQVATCCNSRPCQFFGLSETLFAKKYKKKNITRLGDLSRN